MKAIRTDAIITSVRSKVDRSLGLSVSTPELRPDEMVLFMEVQGRNIELLISPKDENESATVEIKGEGKRRTQSQRIRDALFILWQHVYICQDEPDTFEQFYNRETERIIESIKMRVEGIE